VHEAQQYIAEGHGWVVDLDLEKFFDRVNHDRLLAAVASAWPTNECSSDSSISEGRCDGGRVGESGGGGNAPGGPLSPLLSNLVLDELDRELERRGHHFVRYADDCNIYVGSERAGQRVMESVTHFITHRLKLKVNQAKSAVARPRQRKFLGFSFTSEREPRRRIAPKAIAAVRSEFGNRPENPRYQPSADGQGDRDLPAGLARVFRRLSTPSVLQGLNRGYAPASVGGVEAMEAWTNAVPRASQTGHP